MSLATRFVRPSYIPKWTPDANTVLWLPGQDDPQSAVIRDRSGNLNNGAITGATWTRTGKGLWYLDFDGTDDIVTVTDAASIQNIWAGGGTADIWINPRSDGEGSEGRIFHKIADNNLNGWYILVIAEAAGKVKVQFLKTFTITTGSWRTSATDVTLNTWSKVTVTYNSDDKDNLPIIYVNEVAKAISEFGNPDGTSTSDATKDLILGNNIATATTFDGGQALHKLHNVIKTPALISNEFNQERHLFGV